MVFTIETDHMRPDLAAFQEKTQALKLLNWYQFGTAEQLLDRYFRETFGITLFDACRLIILEAKCALNMENEIIITIPDKKLDDWATIITYGTGKVLGSGVLRFVFSLK